MASTPAYAATPNIGITQVTTANTNLDGTGTIATLFTAGASGSRVDRIVVKAVATSTAGMVRIFIHDGSNFRLYREIDITAAIPSATVKSFRTEISIDGGLILPTGYTLRASTEKTETFNVFALGGDF